MANWKPHHVLAVVMPCCQCPDGAGVLLSHHKLLGLDLAQLTAGAKRPNF